MAPIGKLWSTPGHWRTRKIVAAAKINNLELETPKLEYGVTNKSPEYLAKFPTGKFPCFEGLNGLHLIESDAIALYFAELGPKKDQLLGATPEERVLINQWIWFDELQLEKAISTLVYMRVGYAPYSAEKETENAADFRRWMEVCEKHIVGRKWFVGETGPSLADIVIGGALAVGVVAYIDAEMRKEYPGLFTFYETLRAVPELAGIYDVDMIEKRKEF